jgi:hypothetical membrane protein
MLREISLVYRYSGLLGSTVILVAVALTSLLYVGRQQERYSVFNHAISELGEVGVSRLANLFNGGLIVGGFIFIPFMIGLGLRLDSIWAKLGLLAGLGASGGCIAVGFLPMNRLEAHGRAAITFFRLGLVTILLFTMAIFAQPAGHTVVPLAANIFGGLAVSAYTVFLVLLSAQKPPLADTEEMPDPAGLPERPRFWIVAIAEWTVFLTTLLWFLAVSLALSV